MHRDVRHGLLPGLAMGCAALAAFALPGAASAGGRTSAYTSIANRSCRFDPVGTEPGSEESQAKRCAGLGGTRVVVNSGGTTVSLGFQWPGQSSAREVVIGWSLGETLEWRGAATARGIEPDTVIVRALFNAEGSRTVERQVLAVLHVRAGSACLIGAVDMKENKAPYETAHRLSDRLGSGFRCGKDTASAAGPSTEWTRRVLDRTLREGE